MRVRVLGKWRACGRVPPVRTSGCKKRRCGRDAGGAPRKMTRRAKCSGGDPGVVGRARLTWRGHGGRRGLYSRAERRRRTVGYRLAEGQQGGGGSAAEGARVTAEVAQGTQMGRVRGPRIRGTWRRECNEGDLCQASVTGRIVGIGQPESLAALSLPYLVEERLLDDEDAFTGSSEQRAYRRGDGNSYHEHKLEPRRNTSQGERPKKRAKKTKTDMPAERHKDSLSVLPYDILLEIFMYLGPAGLLQLSRTNKAFRNFLMLRQSAFVWRRAEVLDAVGDEYPPRPPEISELAWAHLIWGGPWCTFCGAKAGKVFWCLRCRICRNCAGNRLVPVKVPPGSELPHVEHFEEMIDGGNLRHEPLTMLENGNTIALVRTSPSGRNAEFLYALSDDLKKFEHDLEKCSDGTFEEQRESFLHKKRHEIIKRAELVDGMIGCQIGYGVKEHLLVRGHKEGDVTSVRIKMHKEVRTTKPLTDKDWIRIEPILLSVVREVRKDRLAKERLERRACCFQLVMAEYLTLLRCVAPSSVSFMPSAANLRKMGPISLVIKEDVEPSEELVAPIEVAISIIQPEIERWIRARFENLQAITPDAWIKAAPLLETDASGAPPEDQSPPRLYDLYDSFASHDLAVYVYRCLVPDNGDLSRSNSYVHGCELQMGLDILAHQCHRDNNDGLSLCAVSELPGYKAAIHILGLVGRDPRRTTPAQMDAENEYFTCLYCHFLPVVVTWRGAILHAVEDHSCYPPRFRALSGPENSYVAARLQCPVECGSPIWGCMHCSVHFNQSHTTRARIAPRRWFSYEAAARHVLTQHGVEAALGRDVFVNRQARRWGRGTSFPLRSGILLISGTTLLGLSELLVPRLHELGNEKEGLRVSKEKLEAGKRVKG
ncbi:hypothetical protein K488DRAFT_74934 [Vararia minispora EC-137]|uniref:Uncharacterized protein n=1 Tax=Vararia minispora EC-137 TaxID=1314806 RepID=A0ACB8Q5S5_9AGAM|nr:hypothetical protein K488DRAFT_74934 [Vararia minispora EC-137]